MNGSASLVEENEELKEKLRGTQQLRLQHDQVSHVPCQWPRQHALPPPRITLFQLVLWAEEAASELQEVSMQLQLHPRPLTPYGLSFVTFLQLRQQLQDARGGSAAAASSAADAATEIQILQVRGDAQRRGWEVVA